MRTFVDDDLRTWEVYSSGSRKGRTRASLIFHCMTDMGARARFVELEGSDTGAAATALRASLTELREMLARSRPLP
jgi:hypothetical protein